MTESMNNAENDKINSGKKRMGFVVDLNISRVLNTLLDYNVYKKDLNVEQKITYLVENNLINIDSDLFESKENLAFFMMTDNIQPYDRLELRKKFSEYDLELTFLSKKLLKL